MNTTKTKLEISEGFRTPGNPLELRPCKCYVMPFVVTITKYPTPAAEIKMKYLDWGFRRRTQAPHDQVTEDSQGQIHDHQSQARLFIDNYLIVERKQVNQNLLMVAVHDTHTCVR